MKILPGLLGLFLILPVPAFSEPDPSRSDYLLEDATPEERIDAIRSVFANRESEKTGQAYRDLISLLGDKDPEVRKQTLALIEELGKGVASGLVHKLEVAMHKGYITTEGISVLTFVDNEDSLAIIARACSHPDRDIREIAYEALRNKGDDAQPIVENLIRLRNEGHDRLSVIEALGIIQGKRAYKELTEIIRSGPIEEKRAALTALMEFERLPQSVVPVLVRASESRDLELHRTALAFLKELTGRDYGIQVKKE